MKMKTNFDDESIIILNGQRKKSTLVRSISSKSLAKPKSFTFPVDVREKLFESVGISHSLVLPTGGKKGRQCTRYGVLNETPRLAFSHEGEGRANLKFSYPKISHHSKRARCKMDQVSESI